MIYVLEVTDLKMIDRRLYEGLFLIDSAKAAADWDGVLTAATTILERAGAEIVSIRKWGERRLAYQIKGVERGTYILTYFNVDGQKISQIERDVQLSELIMRALILKAGHRNKQDIDRQSAAMQVEQQQGDGTEQQQGDGTEQQQGGGTEQQQGDGTEAGVSAETGEVGGEAEQAGLQGADGGEPGRSEREQQ